MRDESLAPRYLPFCDAAAAQVWASLQRGNRRWAAGASRRPRQDPDRRRQVAAGQSPYAVVLSCIDSRVPPEVVFDAGLGDLLVVRTAAHTVDRLVTAAVQFGPQALHARLVVVLGHQRCGAISAAARALRERETLPGELPSIVAAVEPVYTGSGGEVDAMVRAHTVRTVASLRADALLSGKATTVVGAYYSLDTGLVRRVA
ncbi:carbonic anhydrase [Nonomuraea sp. NEAU-A123]|uniref:carbonic anhydrase n=1 Tax=Nonomuraea sp. NEAU-A123 TaxID=2839649 RepID=UPI001BE3FA10|nr:carbonic anhydrase [Nonomuraea sp. NEAU-A123]MBT2227370.1 carbonic anhydrase [Nonomuraea sp. NEAU-A123]